jgi:hypothetical protein
MDDVPRIELMPQDWAEIMRVISEHVRQWGIWAFGLRARHHAG